MDQIAAKLVGRGDQLLHAERVHCKFTGSDAADALLNDLEGHPHAFVLACLADRQVKAEVAWVRESIPKLVEIGVTPSSGNSVDRAIGTGYPEFLLDRGPQPGEVAMAE